MKTKPAKNSQPSKAADPKPASPPPEQKPEPAQADQTELTEKAEEEPSPEGTLLGGGLQNAYQAPETKESAASVAESQAPKPEGPDQPGEAKPLEEDSAPRELSNEQARPDQPERVAEQPDFSQEHQASPSAQSHQPETRQTGGHQPENKERSSLEQSHRSQAPNQGWSASLTQSSWHPNSSNHWGGSPSPSSGGWSNSAGWAPSSFDWAPTDTAVFAPTSLGESLLDPSLGLGELEEMMPDMLETQLLHTYGVELTDTVLDLATLHPDLSLGELVELGEQAAPVSELAQNVAGLEPDQMLDDTGLAGAGVKPVLHHEPSRQLLGYRLDIEPDDLARLSGQLRHSLGTKGGEAYGRVVEAMRGRPDLHPRDVAQLAASGGATKEEKYDQFVRVLGLSRSPQSKEAVAETFA